MQPIHGPEQELNYKDKVCKIEFDELLDLWTHPEMEKHLIPTKNDFNSFFSR